MRYFLQVCLFGYCAEQLRPSYQEYLKERLIQDALWLESENKSMRLPSGYKLLLLLALLLICNASSTQFFHTALTAHAASASIKLNPNAGPPTSPVKVSGKGFGRNEQVLITFDSNPLATAMTNNAGSF